MEIDIERLREDVIDYVGSAMASVAPMALIDVISAEMANPERLLQIAKQYDFDIGKYIINDD